MSGLLSISDLMSEEEVYSKYRRIFADKELREARQTGELEFYKLRKGIFYREDQLIAYLEKRKQQPCQNRPLNPEESELSSDSGNSKTNGSGQKKAHLISIDTSTREMDELAARALERQT